MKTLTTKECIEILKSTETLPNIFLHCRKVNAIAVYLAMKLKEKGVQIDLDLVNNASLLHDVKKFHCLGKEKEVHHEKEGKIFLKSLGYDEIANIVGKHGGKSLVENNLHTWEEKIVNYADTRVNHDEIVSLDERFTLLNDRYNDIYPNVIERNKIIKEYKEVLEKEIFERLDINPEDITEENVEDYLIEDDY